MGDDKPFDLFSQEGKSKKPPPPKKKPPPIQEGPPPSDHEVKKMMDRMSGLYEEIRTSVADAFGEKGFSSEELTLFLDDPQNFSDEQWGLIQEEREKWEQKIWGQLGEERKIKAKEEKKVKKGKKSKGKSLGARKKWLEMR